MDRKILPGGRLPSLQARILISAAALVQIAILLAICARGLPS
jgi:hypothetical protein